MFSQGALPVTHTNTLRFVSQLNSGSSALAERMGVPGPFGKADRGLGYEPILRSSYAAYTRAVESLWRDLLGRDMLKSNGQQCEQAILCARWRKRSAS